MVLFKQKKFFKNFLVLMVLSLVMFTVIGCAKDDKIDLSFAKDSYELKVGDVIEVKPTVIKGKDVKEVVLLYSSADPKIATYIDGKVTGVAVGHIKVKVAVKDKANIFKEVTINVTAAQVEIYEIVYHLNEGVNAKANPDSYKSTDLPISLAEPTREGYKFLGWFANDQFTGKAVTKITTGESGKKEFYAKWEMLSYNVTFDVEGETTIKKVNHGEPVTKLDDPVKDGYKFLGWFVGDEEFDFETIVTKDIILVAKFDEIPVVKYTVTFDVEGVKETKQVIKGEVVTAPDDPVKDGYTFSGWFVGDEEFNFETLITEDITLVAKFAPLQTFEITYELNGGVNHNEAPKSFFKNQEVVLLEATRNGYTFEGWYLEENLSGDVVTKISGVDENVILYAKWDKVVSNIVMNLNEGYWRYPNKEAMAEDFLTDFYNYLKTTDMSPTEDLNTFIHGIDKTSGFAGTWDNDTTYKTKLYAAKDKSSDALKPYFINQPEYNEKWLSFFDFLDALITERASNESLWGSVYQGIRRINLYFQNKTFSAEQLAKVPNYRLIPNTYTVESETIILQTPIRAGYTFIGWFDNDEFNGEAITEIATGSYGNKEYFAKWEESLTIKYTVTFDVEGEQEVKEVVEGEPVTAPADPVKEGYIFLGWFIGEEEFNFETLITEDITLVAKFEKAYNPIEITEEVDPFTQYLPQLITVSTVANDDLGKLVRAHFTLPLGLTLEYQEGGDGPWIALVDVFGPVSGFPLGDITTQFRATALVDGTFTITVEFKVVETGEVLGIKDITVEVAAVNTVLTAREAAINDIVVVRGVVTSLIGNNAFIQDETAGIYVYLGSNAEFADQLIIGNDIIVSGKRATFNELDQLSNITSIEVIAIEVDLPAVETFEELVIDDLLTVEGKLVTVTGLEIKTIPTIGTGSYSVIATDGVTDLEIRIDKSIAQFAEVKALFETMIVGQGIDFVQVPVGRFNANPQLMVSDVEHLVVKPITAALLQDYLNDELNPGQNATENVNLLTVYTVGGIEYTITWVSSNESVISIDGVITRPANGEADILVTLTARVQFSAEEQFDLTYEITVLAEVEGFASATYDFSKAGAGSKTTFEKLDTWEYIGITQYTYGGTAFRVAGNALQTKEDFGTIGGPVNVTIKAGGNSGQQVLTVYALDSNGDTVETKEIICLNITSESQGLALADQTVTFDNINNNITTFKIVMVTKTVNTILYKVVISLGD